MTAVTTFERFTAELVTMMNGPGSSSARRAVWNVCFDAMALELFALQCERVPAYRRWCTSRGSTPDRVGSWQEIPAVPTEAFKEFEFSALPAAERSTVFLSSGTTAASRSRHFHSPASLVVYETSLLAWFGNRVFGREPRENGVGSELSASELGLICLTPSARAAPHSSLVYMFDAVERNYSFCESAFVGTVDGDGAWGLDLSRTVAALDRCKALEVPVVLMGTAFSFVQLLDHLTERKLSMRLPPGSIVMETGGYKGRTRSIPKERLHELIGRNLGIPSSSVVSEYGMCELSSQAYASWACGAASVGAFVFPPWARALVVSSETGLEVSEGEIGLLQVFDLANVFSVLAVQTSDLAIKRGEGFELAGRAAQSEPRGCSLMVEVSGGDESRIWSARGPGHSNA